MMARPNKMHNKRANRFKEHKYKVARYTPSNKLEPESMSGDDREHRSWSVKKYKVSIHCILRYAERVLNNKEWLNREEQVSIAESIVGSIDFDLDNVMNGSYPFLDGYKVVVKDGTCITVKKTK